MWKKPKNDSRQQESLFRGVLLANFVLFSHVALIFAVAFLAFFSGAVIAYLPWILGIGGLIVVSTAFVVWRRLKKQGKHLKDVLNDPTFQNRTIEVSLLGGMASLRVGQPQGPTMIQYESSKGPRQLRAPKTDYSDHPGQPEGPEQVVGQHAPTLDRSAQVQQHVDH